MKLTPLDYAIRAMLDCSGLQPYETEYEFMKPERKFRFDYAWVPQKTALEVEGAVYASGRHSRGRGMEQDIVKYNEAALRGWIVIRASTTQIRRNPQMVIDWLRRAIDGAVNLGG